MTRKALDSPKAGATNRKFFGLFIYLWLLLTLFSLHTAFIFNQSLLAFQQVFALINALLLAKIIVASHALQLGRENGGGFLIAAVMKSALISLIFLLLNVAEEAAMGVYRGEIFWEALPTIDDGSLQAILMTAIIACVSLIPLFVVMELEVRLGTQELSVLLLGERRAGSGNGEHEEKHFLNSETVRDVVIGMADGLTVPFALAAGISAAIASTHVVVAAGMAEIVAGATAMGLGGYLAARGDQEHFESEEKREYLEIEKLPQQERGELREIFAEFGLQAPEVDTVIAAISADKKRWVDFMMRFELGLEKPNPKRAPISAATIAVAYFVGG